MQQRWRTSNATLCGCIQCVIIVFVHGLVGSDHISSIAFDPIRNSKLSVLGKSTCCTFFCIFFSFFNFNFNFFFIFFMNPLFHLISISKSDTTTPKNANHSSLWLDLMPYDRCCAWTYQVRSFSFLSSLFCVNSISKSSAIALKNSKCSSIWVNLMPNNCCWAWTCRLQSYQH